MEHVFNIWCILKVNFTIILSVTLILIFSFYLGAIANELESDFSKLLAVGQLHEQTLKISGYYPTNVKLKIPYQGCPVYNKKLASSKF